MGDASRKCIKVKPILGLHARLASCVTTVASYFTDTEISVLSKERKADPRSIMELMVLAAPAGTVLWVDAQGPDSELAAASVARVLTCSDEEVFYVTHQIREELKRRGRISEEGGEP